MQTASFLGFIKALFYILIFYYIFKFLVRLFLPFILKKVVEKASQNMHKHQFNEKPNWKKNSTDGVIYNSPNSKKSYNSKKIGEYIDYEEID